MLSNIVSEWTVYSQFQTTCFLDRAWTHLYGFSWCIQYPLRSLLVQVYLKYGHHFFQTCRLIIFQKRTPSIQNCLLIKNHGLSLTTCISYILEIMSLPRLHCGFVCQPASCILLSDNLGMLVDLFLCQRPAP